MDALSSHRLTGRDYVSLVAVCLIFFGLHRAIAQTLNVHETVHCQNTREMLADGDWVIPHYGGRPWLERPPLPFWITAGFVAVLGDRDWSYLLPPMLLGVSVVLLTANMAAGWFGRGVGIISGAVLATCHEFICYASGAEADIFLCFLITLAVALFVRAEFGSEKADERCGFFGGRPRTILMLFVVLGLTNLTKGLIFGAVLAVLPMVAFLLIDRPSSLWRYIWFWGWLVFAAIALAWPLLVYLRYPDAIDFWRNDYLFRAVEEDAESGWYYLRVLPWMLLPWTPYAFAGAWLARPEKGVIPPANRGRWFVLCWAIVPLAALSFSRHKHHHYLLHALAPWAMFAALGIVLAWEWLIHRPFWLRRPALLQSGPACLVTTLALLCLGRLAMDVGQRLYFDHYKEDRAFLAQVCAAVPAGEPILVNGKDGALTASWWLHYGHGRIHLLHNLTFLLDDHLSPTEVYLIARRHVAADLAVYGTAEVICESQHSRQEYTLDCRYTLFRLRYYPDLARRSANVRFTPLQATCRVPGPYLD